jgi:hypothetical protein
MGPNEWVPIISGNSPLLRAQFSATIIKYGYTPSYAPAISAAVLFSVSLLAHLVQHYIYRTWYFITIPIALVLEIIGYIFRSFSANKDPYSVIYFVVQYFFIVCAPVFLSAGIYVILSVLNNRIGRECSPIPPKLLLWVFITSDVVCTIMQVAGAALIGSAQSNNKDPNTGNHILTTGLSSQVFVFAIFLILTACFFLKPRARIWEHGRKGFLAAFGVATLLVYLRTCFRLAETAEGVMGKLFSSEGFFAGLEFVPILVAVVLFNLWHPGRCLKRVDGSDEGDGGVKRKKRSEVREGEMGKGSWDHFARWWVVMTSLMDYR